MSTSYKPVCVRIDEETLILRGAPYPVSDWAEEEIRALEREDIAQEITELGMIARCDNNKTLAIIYANIAALVRQGGQE